MARFDALEVSVEAAEALAEALQSIARHDGDLARQLRRAIASVHLNIAEGARRNGKDRLHAFRIAAGSAAEARGALRLAVAWRFIPRSAVEAGDQRLDRVGAMLWRLTNARP